MVPMIISLKVFTPILHLEYSATVVFDMEGGQMRAGEIVVVGLARGPSVVLLLEERDGRASVAIGRNRQARLPPPTHPAGHRCRPRRRAAA